MKTNTIMLLAATLTCVWGCGELGNSDGPLTADESVHIYESTLNKINAEASGLMDSKTVGCAPSGSYTLTGKVEGSSIDRTYDIDMTASNCEMVAINGDGSRLEIVVNGGPVKGVKNADGGITLSGTFSWTTADGRSGTCTMTPATSTCE